MKERPILMSAPMVRAILEGRKTQTRRVVKYKPYAQDGAPVHPHECPYGVPGDRLWVRETWHKHKDGDVCYLADNQCDWLPWKPSIYMPFYAHRITLEITGVRVERVQEISEEDAKAEGVIWVEQEVPRSSGNWVPCAVGEYRTLWNSLNSKRGHGWDENPWVWVIEFKRVA